MQEFTVCFLGAGAMAESMIKGALQEEILSSEQIMALDIREERNQVLRKTYGITTARSLVQAQLPQTDIIVLSFKPKDLASALEEYRDSLHSGQLVISFLAGVKTCQIEKHLPAGMPVVRAMPNTAAAIGMAATAICPGQMAQERHLVMAEALFAAAGLVRRVPESLMDAVTALSGSGPAYVYLLAEAMEAGGVAAGLDTATARALTAQTLLGAAHMLQVSQKTPQELRQQVTSPGGTTMAGIQALMEHHFTDAVQAAILRAADRSRYLARQTEAAD